MNEFYTPDCLTSFEIPTKLIFEYRKNTTLSKIREILLIKVFVCFQRNRNTT